MNPEARKKYYQKNKEKEKAAANLWRKKNIEKANEISRKCWAKNKEKYYANRDQEKLKKTRKEYYQKHKEEVKAKCLARYNKKKDQLKKERQSIRLKTQYWKQREKTFAFHNKPLLESAVEMYSGSEELRDCMQKLLNKGLAYDRRNAWRELRKDFEAIKQMQVAA